MTLSDGQNRLGNRRAALYSEDPTTDATARILEANGERCFLTSARYRIVTSPESEAQIRRSPYDGFVGKNLCRRLDVERFRLPGTSGAVSSFPSDQSPPLRKHILATQGLCWEQFGPKRPLPGSILPEPSKGPIDVIREFPFFACSLVSAFARLRPCYGDSRRKPARFTTVQLK